jgi:hypothetical protein
MNLMIPPLRQYYTTSLSSLTPPAHSDTSDEGRRAYADKPYPYLMTMFLHLGSVPEKPMEVLWPIAKVAAKWLGLKTVTEVYQGYVGSSTYIRQQDLFKNVSLDDSRVEQLVNHGSELVGYSAVSHSRRGAERPILDYMLWGRLAPRHCKTTTRDFRYHPPCLEMAVRVNPAKVGVPQIQELADALCASAGEHLDIAHGCIEYGLAHHLGNGYLYVNEFGPTAHLDRVHLTYLWSKVTDPSKVVYRLGHATFLSPYFLERLSDDEPVEEWFMKLRPNRYPTHFITELPRGVKAFWLSTNPVEFMGDEIGLHRTTSLENSVVIGAELLHRLRSRGLTL